MRSSINDVTLFGTIFDPLPHCRAFYWGLSAVVTKSWPSTPMNVTSFIVDIFEGCIFPFLLLKMVIIQLCLIKIESLPNWIQLRCFLLRWGIVRPSIGWESYKSNWHRIGPPERGWDEAWGGLIQQNLFNLYLVDYSLNWLQCIQLLMLWD